MKYFVSFFVLAALTFAATAQESPAPTANPPKAEFRLAVDEPTEGFTESVYEDGEKKIFVANTVVLTSDDVAYTRVVEFPGGGKTSPALEVVFTPEGATRIQTISKENIGRRIAVVLDGKVISAPTIRTEIRNKTIITGTFTDADVARIAKIIAPPKFEARMLLIKADWLPDEGAKTIEDDLRQALDGAAIPKKLLDQLPGSGPEILFPRQIVSLYKLEHYADLLEWLKARKLFVDELPFPAAECVPQGGLDLAGGETHPSYSTTLTRPVEFFIPTEKLGRYFSFEIVPKPFVKRKPMFQWYVAETRFSNKRHFTFTRAAELQEDKRGNESDTVLYVDETTFQCELPTGHVAIMNAFASDREQRYASGAAENGFLPLVVSIPVTATKAVGKPQV